MRLYEEQQKLVHAVPKWRPGVRLRPVRLKLDMMSIYDRRCLARSVLVLAFRVRSPVAPVVYFYLPDFCCDDVSMFICSCAHSLLYVALVRVLCFVDLISPLENIAAASQVYRRTQAEFLRENSPRQLA